MTNKEAQYAIEVRNVILNLAHKYDLDKGDSGEFLINSLIGMSLALSEINGIELTFTDCVDILENHITRESLRELI